MIFFNGNNWSIELFFWIDQIPLTYQFGDGLSIIETYLLLNENYLNFNSKSYVSVLKVTQSFNIYKGDTRRFTSRKSLW